MIVVLVYCILIAISWYSFFSLNRIVRKDRSLILVVPVLAIYFWSLFGVWSWIPRKLGGDYLYYEDELFPMPIDLYYLQMVLYYSLFLLVFLTIINHMSSHTNDKANSNVLLKFILRLRKSKRFILIIVLCFIFFAYFARQDILTAMLTGETAYKVGRFDSSAGGFYGLFQYSGDLFMFLLIPLLIPGGDMHSLKKVFLLSLLIVFFVINLILGNRNIFIVGLSVYFLLYVEIYGLKKLFSPKGIIIIILLLLAIESIYFFRAMSVDDLMAGNTNFNLMELIDGLTGSSEKYFAQMSMYGVLVKDVGFTYGSSILFLISSLIPGFWGISRPTDIYNHYINGVMGASGTMEKGFTIHHATGWYLNFGIIGIVLGAFLWAHILMSLYKRKKSFLHLYAVILFSSVSIQMIRGGGLETYKAALIMSTFIPVLIMKVSLIKFKWRR